jgi:hypothetical protein
LFLGYLLVGQCYLFIGYMFLGYLFVGPTLLRQQFPSLRHFQKMPKILWFDRKLCQPATFLSAVCATRCGAH